MTGARPPRSMRQAVSILPGSIDELSTIRYIHAQSLRAAAVTWAGEDEIAAFIAYVYEPGYAADIETSIRRQTFFGAYLDQQLVGTCGWSPVADDTAVARVRWCHVLPLFARMGIGLAVLTAAEQAAEAAGHGVLVARTTPHASAFFERAGYGITAHGNRAVGAAHSLPVTFLRKNLGATSTSALF